MLERTTQNTIVIIKKNPTHGNHLVDPTHIALQQVTTEAYPDVR